MKSNSFSIKFILLSIFLVVVISGLNAQPKQDSLANRTLYVEIAHMDSVLFNAFNVQDLTTLKKVFDTDLEFYHDLGGLTNYAQNIEAFKTNFAKNYGLRRELVPGSLEIYPIKDYGAIQIGSHTFCHKENGKQDCGTFKFVHVWQKKMVSGNLPEWLVTAINS